MRYFRCHHCFGALVGIYLVFASLIVPALATHRHARRRYSIAFAIGIAVMRWGCCCCVARFACRGAIVWPMALTDCGAVHQEPG